MPTFHELNLLDIEGLPWPDRASVSFDLTAALSAPSTALSDPLIRVSLERFAGGTQPFAARAAADCYVLVLGSGTSSYLEVLEADEGRGRLLRRGEVARLDPAGAVRFRAPDPVDLLAVSAGSKRTELQLIDLGEREFREPLSAAALLWVTAGAASVRATNEEEPFEVRAGTGLWGSSSRDGDEWVLRGMEDGTEVALVHLEP